MISQKRRNKWKRSWRREEGRNYSGEWSGNNVGFSNACFPKLFGILVIYSVKLFKFFSMAHFLLDRSHDDGAKSVMPVRYQLVSQYSNKILSSSMAHACSPI